MQANTQTDPIVEILLLAYRRGLALRQEQAASKTVDSNNLDRTLLPTVQRPTSERVNCEET